MIEQNLNAEGCVLVIKSDIRTDDLAVFWNADTPERSVEMSPDEEIFIHVKTSYLSQARTSSIALSVYEAKTLRDTLDYMINTIKTEKEKQRIKEIERLQMWYKKEGFRDEDAVKLTENVLNSINLVK